MRKSDSRCVGTDTHIAFVSFGFQRISSVVPFNIARTLAASPRFLFRMAFGLFPLCDSTRLTNRAEPSSKFRPFTLPFFRQDNASKTKDIRCISRNNRREAAFEFQASLGVITWFRTTTIDLAWKCKCNKISKESHDECINDGMNWIDIFWKN